MAQQLTISERLEWLLEQRGMSQNALARGAKVSPQTVANALHHGRMPHAKTLQRFARTLGVPVAVFSARSLTVENLQAFVAGGAGARAARATGSQAKKPAAGAKSGGAKSTAAPKSAAAPKSKTATPRSKTATPKSKTGTANTAGTTSRGGRRGTGPTIGEQIWTRCCELIDQGSSAKAAFQVVARERGTTVGNVQQQYYRLRRKSGVTGRTIVRHGSGAARRAASAGRSGAAAGRSTAAGAAVSLSGLTAPIDFDAVVGKLQKLANSRTEQVALDACKALLSLRK